MSQNNSLNDNNNVQNIPDESKDLLSQLESNDINTHNF